MINARQADKNSAVTDTEHTAITPQADYQTIACELVETAWQLAQGVRDDSTQFEIEDSAFESEAGRQYFLEHTPACLVQDLINNECFGDHESIYDDMLSVLASDDTTTVIIEDVREHVHTTIETTGVIDQSGAFEIDTLTVVLE